MPHGSPTDKLIGLAQLDIDALLAYDQAIANVLEPEIRHVLEGFRADHERHAAELGKLIADYGGEPPICRRDFKGFLLAGMTAIAGEAGTRGALMAMTGNETLTNSRYRSALSFYLPPEAMQMVEQFFADEQRHAAYITATLKSKFDLSEILGSGSHELGDGGAVAPA
jgi:rubrerythrin